MSRKRAMWWTATPLRRWVAGAYLTATQEITVELQQGWTLDPRKRWWQRRDFARDTLVGIGTRRWWWLWWWQWVEGPFWRTLIWVGVWEIAEGGYYRAGRWRWRGSAHQRVRASTWGFWRYVWGRW